MKLSEHSDKDFANETDLKIMPHKKVKRVTLKKIIIII